MNSWDYLKKVRKDYAALLKISKESDPASGVSFSVRRGVAHDNEAVEDDETRRPWVTTELSDPRVVADVMSSLLSGAQARIEYWTSVVKRDIKDAEAVLRSP